MKELIENPPSVFNWTCPHCERAVTITGHSWSVYFHTLTIENLVGQCTIVSIFIVCPNPDCQKYTLVVQLYESHFEKNLPMSARAKLDNLLQEWALIPSSKAKTFPSYIPKAILEDYREACLIRDLSPKASATLARRCLQGMIRNFWSVKPGRLVDEINAIEEKVDPRMWDAIQAVRKLGNIGAHMEKDIDVIVDVDPGEADLLIGLIETLLREWYVARQEREDRVNALIAAAASKKP
jgi:hypothetical protein